MPAAFDLWPALHSRAARTALAQLPTPVEDASALLSEAGQAGELWLKRDDRSSPIYGGSKLRLLELLLGQAAHGGATHVYASGAVGSNFTLATALHARRAGLTPGAICFPQPITEDGARNQAALSAHARVIELAHWSLLPVASERERLLGALRGERSVVLSQVRFGAEALLGYVSAGLELAQQVAAGDCPAPARVVLPIGSAATSAGLVAGLSLAYRLGLWRAPAPRVVAVRIAAWPLSRRARVLSLAESALARLAELAGDASLALRKAELVPLDLVTDQLGPGYPHGTSAGAAALQRFAAAGWPILDATYSAKAAAHALELTARGAPGPVLFWCTKSSAALA